MLGRMQKWSRSWVQVQTMSLALVFMRRMTLAKARVKPEMYLIHRPLEIIRPASRNYGQGTYHCQGVTQDRAGLTWSPYSSQRLPDSRCQCPGQTLLPSRTLAPPRYSLKIHLWLVGAAWLWKALAFSPARGLLRWEIRRLVYDGPSR